MFLSKSVKKSVRTCKISFFFAGVSMAAWAPLVPFLKTYLNISHVSLSYLILCLGIGSILGMFLTAGMITYLGSKKAFIVIASVLTFSLASVVYTPSFSIAFITVFFYGLAIGALEVGSNIFAAHLEKKYDFVLMPTMHGFYSSGEIISLLLVTSLLHFAFSIQMAIMMPIIAIFAVFLLVSYGFCHIEISKRKSFSMPRGIVLTFALIGSFILMVEGSMLDWSSLLMLQKTDIAMHLSSSGYIVLVVFLTIGRFLGAVLIERFSVYKVLFFGLLCSMFALLLLFYFQSIPLLYLSFALLGLSMANILPIAVSLSAKQNNMPAIAAISAVSSCAYLALIVGPAFIGYIAGHLNLNAAFLILALIGIAITIMTRKVVYAFTKSLNI